MWVGHAVSALFIRWGPYNPFEIFFFAHKPFTHFFTVLCFLVSSAKNGWAGISATSTFARSRRVNKEDQQVDKRH